jgi:hypothetical protein
VSRTVSRAVVVVLVLGAVIAGAAGAFRSQESSGTGPGASPPATQPVVRGDLPSAGQVIRQGQVLYRWITASR